MGKLFALPTVPETINVLLREVRNMFYYCLHNIWETQFLFCYGFFFLFREVLTNFSHKNLIVVLNFQIYFLFSCVMYYHPNFDFEKLFYFFVYSGDHHVNHILYIFNLFLVTHLTQKMKNPIFSFIFFFWSAWISSNFMARKHRKKNVKIQI